jgi:hypothetical protein
MEAGSGLANGKNRLRLPLMLAAEIRPLLIDQKRETKQATTASSFAKVAHICADG